MNSADPTGLFVAGQYDFTVESFGRGLEVFAHAAGAVWWDNSAIGHYPTPFLIISVPRPNPFDAAFGDEAGYKESRNSLTVGVTALDLAIGGRAAASGSTRALKGAVKDPGIGWADKIERHHPFVQQWSREIKRQQPGFNHPAFDETVPIRAGDHRGKGGLHSQGYNKFIEEMIEARGGPKAISMESVDEIMDILRELGIG